MRRLATHVLLTCLFCMVNCTEAPITMSDSEPFTSSL